MSSGSSPEAAILLVAASGTRMRTRLLNLKLACACAKTKPLVKSGVKVRLRRRPSLSRKTYYQWYVHVYVISVRWHFTFSTEEGAVAPKRMEIFYNHLAHFFIFIYILITVSIH